MATNDTDDVSNISVISVGVFSGSDSKLADTSLFAVTHILSNLVIGGLGTLVISLFGVISNVINCLVFYHQGLRDRMNLCLFSLALSDFWFVLCSAVYSLVKVFSILYLKGFAEEVKLYTINYGIGVIYAFRTTSGLYLMVIAVERCVCVAFPFQASSLIKTRTMAMFLSIIALISHLGFIGQSLKYKVIETEVGGWQIVPSSLWLKNRIVIDTIVYVIFTISVPLITFLTVSLATFITVIKLTSAMAWRRKTSSTSTDQDDRQTALTKMLVLASCVYILSMMPMVLIKAVRLFVEEFSSYGVYASLYGVCNAVADISPVINSSVYVFIYYNRSARYRHELSAACIYTKKHSMKTSSLSNNT
ncbi:uncharacterized protein LOC112566916 [Pomacea canaliculata]|uniref:uncharacterized protein LOC112566916 n=1 Tax=Pomacea canaliculata TaxID=400727 RepID=UPI000D72DFCD|nr:uncharacterized protein LOC112566916 [Pomacea canaliculata]